MEIYTVESMNWNLINDFAMQKKKKTKTVVEKYWDWELTNETQPIWVSSQPL